MKNFFLHFQQRLSLKLFILFISAILPSLLAQENNNSIATQNLPMPQVPTINASAYLLIDFHSNQILAEKNSHQRYHPASLVKMMTSYVIGQAIKSGKIGYDDQVIVPHAAWATGNPIFKGSSLMFLKPGDIVSMHDLTRGINLQSGNDATVAAAYHVAGSEEGFVELMNHYAKELGLSNTQFKNVHGLDATDQYTSAHDIVLLGQALIRDLPQEYESYKEKFFIYNNIKQYNRNRLLWDHTLKVDGIKTGHTESAGYNLVASSTHEKMRFIVAVLGTKSANAREAEAKKLLLWATRVFETISCTAIAQEKKPTSAKVWFGHQNRVQIGTEKNCYLTVERGKSALLTREFLFNNEKISAPLMQGDVVGSIHYKMGDQIITKKNLIALEEVKAASGLKKLWDQFICLFS